MQVPFGDGFFSPWRAGECQPGCWLVHCSTVAAGRFPAPAGAANRAASSKAACCIRHRRRCAAFPPFSLFGCAKKRKRAVHGPKEKNRLRLNIRGIPIRGRAGSHRAVLPIYLPATGVLNCFAAGDEGVVLRSHVFLGSLLKPRLLLVSRLPSFVSRWMSLVPRLSSLPPQGRGNAQGGTAVPS